MRRLQEQLRLSGADLTEAQQGAIAFHEIFLHMTGAGFTEDQAIRYLAYLTVFGRQEGMDSD